MFPRICVELPDEKRRAHQECLAYGTKILDEVESERLVEVELDLLEL